MSAKIELKPESARQRQDTFSSLTDLHGIPVFSDDFKIKVNAVKENCNLEEMTLYSLIFVDGFNKKEGKDDLIISQLFSENETLILKQDYQHYGEKVSIVEVGLVTIAVIGVMALYVFVFRNKRVRRKDL